MKGKVTVLFCMALLVIFGYQTTASENDMIIIHVLIFPPQNQIGSLDTNWTTELQLIMKTTAEDPNGSTAIIDEQIVKRKGRAANSSGSVDWKAPVHKSEVSERREQIKYYYKVVCYGGGAYNDGVSKEMDAATIDEYNITITMNHK